jgi:alkylated DNA repair dioxygenase AlkB
MKQLNFIQDIGEAEEVSSDIFDYRPAIFNKADSARFLKTFLETVPWGQTSQLMYGKKVVTPRLTAWFGDPNTDYSIDGNESPTLPWTPELLEIKAEVEAISGIAFNSVLLNFYRDGNDSVAWHSDRDGVTGRNKYVASVSFGQERRFDLRKKDDPTKTFTVLLEDGSYLLMKGEFQDQWQHRIAKSRLSMGPRVNLTFRISRRLG